MTGSLPVTAHLSVAAVTGVTAAAHLGGIGHIAAAHAAAKTQQESENAAEVQQDTAEPETGEVL